MLYTIIALIVALALIGYYIHQEWIDDSRRLYRIISDKYTDLYPEMITDLIEVFGFATTQQRRKIFFYLDTKKYGKLRALLNKYLEDYDKQIHID